MTTSLTGAALLSTGLCAQPIINQDAVGDLTRNRNIPFPGSASNGSKEEDIRNWKGKPVLFLTAREIQNILAENFDSKLTPQELENVTAIVEKSLDDLEGLGPYFDKLDEGDREKLGSLIKERQLEKRNFLALLGESLIALPFEMVLSGAFAAAEKKCVIL